MKKKEDKNAVKGATKKIINELYSDGDRNSAALASLRNTTSITDQRAKDVWPIIFPKLDKQALSNNFTNEPSFAETAIYTALHCYAIYQRGVDTCVYAEKQANGKQSELNPAGSGIELFQALASLRNPTDDGSSSVAIDRRIKTFFSMAGTVSATKSMQGVTNSLTQLVKILKATNKKSGVLKIDFAQLAQDLFYFQKDYEKAKQVLLKWGQQYYWQASRDSLNNKDQQVEAE